MSLSEIDGVYVQLLNVRGFVVFFSTEQLSLLSVVPEKLYIAKPTLAQYRESFN